LIEFLASARWSLLVATLVTSTLLLTGCGNEPPSSVEAETDAAEGADSHVAAEDSVDLACRRDDDGQSINSFEVQSSSSMTQVVTTPFRCLRLLSVADISSAGNDVRIVDIGREAADGPAAGRQLRIPLHEIKTKAFLRGKSLAIVSDGTQFAAIEKECNDIKASGIGDVIALLPELAKPLGESDDLLPYVARLTPPEFIAERAYGNWHFINLSSDETLRSPLFIRTGQTNGNPLEAKQHGTGSGLERTLIIVDGDNLPAANVLSRIPRNRGQMFLLDGGLSGLERFQAEAIAMARALAQPRINERGCAG